MGRSVNHGNTTQRTDVDLFRRDSVHGLQKRCSLKIFTCPGVPSRVQASPPQTYTFHMDQAPTNDLTYEQKHYLTIFPHWSGGPRPIQRGSYPSLRTPQLPTLNLKPQNPTRHPNPKGHSRIQESFLCGLRCCSTIWTPPWRQPRGKSEVNLPQMQSSGGMRVDSRNHLFAPWLSSGWRYELS